MYSYIYTHTFKYILLIVIKKSAEKPRYTVLNLRFRPTCLRKNVLKFKT